jgi:hydrophobic/amphiphilic exporter-1 (mainly G- bacteria), HAE1 family
MQKLAEICIKRPVFAAMIILALVVVGAASYYQLGIDRYPSFDQPTVTVRTSLPGASPEEVETEISEKIEEVVNTVAGVQELRSVSNSGNSFCIATFSLDTDIETAAQDVRDRVATVIRQLPEDADPPIVSKFNNDSAAVLSIALSANRPVRELTELADKIVKPQLERATGVGEVQILGALNRAINVWIDADRLAAYQIPVTTVRNAIVRQNADVPGGNVTQGGREQTLRTMGKIQNVKDFEEVVVATINNVPVRLKDVSRVEDGTREQRTLSRLNGVPNVTIEIRRQSGANTIEVIDAVKANLEKVQGQIPSDVKVEIIRDQSRYINAALHEINLHLVLGSILACLVVLVFMRNWRSTIIAGIAIPTSVIATFGMMRALDFTLNSVTMLALVLMVGVVIDDAIVVLENIFRFIEEKKMRPFEAARAATAEIGLAVMATTFSLVVIFLPVSFMSSISGRFLYQFGITAAVAIMVSLVVSFTLTPMMSARLLKAEDAKHDEAKSRGGFYGIIDRMYSWMLIFCMRHRFAIAVVALLVIFSSVPLYGIVKQDFIPSDVDESEFDVNISAREGTSLEAMNTTMQVIEKEILSTPGVQLILANAGGGFGGGVNNGGMYVRITPIEERSFSLARLWKGLKSGAPMDTFRNNYSQRDVMNEVRNRLRKFKDVRGSVRNAQSFNLGGGPSEIDFVFRGPDLESLFNYADHLRQKAPDLGIVDADVTLKLDKPEMRINIDRQRAADLGVAIEDIAIALRLMVGGDQQVSRYRDSGVNDDYDVQLRVQDGGRNDRKGISQLYVPSQGNGLVRLDNLVSIDSVKAPSRIDRLDRQRQVSLRASVAPGYALADRLEALRNEVKTMNLPAAYTTAVSGRAKELERTFNEFIWAFLLSVIFMYMILASQFESLIHPFTILLSLPLSVPFALISLWGTGNTLNLYSALGILVLFGVVKKNSILQIDHMNNLRAQGMERFSAIIQANRDRLRPILMTTLALVAGMMPLAVGTGPGSDERRAIAVVVIGGQTLSLLLTLLVTPVVYSLLDDLAETAAWRALAARTSVWTHPLKNLLARRRKAKAVKEDLEITAESGD